MEVVTIIISITKMLIMKSLSIINSQVYFQLLKCGFLLWLVSSCSDVSLNSSHLFLKGYKELIRESAKMSVHSYRLKITLHSGNITHLKIFKKHVSSSSHISSHASFIFRMDDI